MFVLVDDMILNTKRMTTIEVDRDTPTEVNYLFNDGGIIKEKFKTKEEAIERVEDLDDNQLLIPTIDERLINIIYIKDVELDHIVPNRVIYVLYNGAPVKVAYENKQKAKEALIEIREKLEEMRSCCETGDGSGGGGSIDLSAYLKKTVADRTYVKIADMPDFNKFVENTDLKDYAKKTDVPTNTEIAGIVKTEVVKYYDLEII